MNRTAHRRVSRRYSKQVRRGEHWAAGLLAYIGVLAKVIVRTLPDTDEDARTAAVARGKLRYSWFLRSAGANMAGDSHAALSESVNRVAEWRW